MKRKLLPCLLAALLAASLAPVFFAAPRPVAAGTADGVSYILANQAADGGFREPGRGDAGQDATTAWCVMALAAAGVEARETRKDGRSPLDFLASQAGNWRSVTDYERTLLAVAAAGEDPRSFAGMDLLARVRSYQGGEGNIGDAVNSNAFGMLAYRAAGEEIPAGAVRWHRGAQNPDGGWGNSPGAASNPDMTAASIMALRAAGVDAGDHAIASALSYLRSIQNDDGGFSFQPGASDTAATAWCVQAITAAGQDPAGSAWSKGGNTPRSFLLSMQAADGHFAWMRGREMNPVWVTSYAVCALSGRPFPVSVYRPQAPSGSGAGAQGGGNAGGDGAAGSGPAVPGGGGEAAVESSAGGEGGGAQEGEQAATDEEAPAGGVEALDALETDAREGTAAKPQEEGRGGFPVAALIAILLVGAACLAVFGWWIFRRLARR